MAIEITGNWAKGYALDLHTTGSEYLGDDQYGHPQFNTTRSEIGQLLYDLKYKGKKNVIPKIIIKIKECITGIEKFDYIVSIPPSNTDRPFQPVELIGQALSSEYKIPFLNDAIIKMRSTEELKNVSDISKRKEILEDTLSFNTKHDLKGKNVLIIDDLYRSGSTLAVVTDLLYKHGHAACVNVIVLTKTRSNR